MVSDAAKFGQAYLSKFGWNPSEGLGVEGDGRTSHIKVAQKLDMLGIGAGAQKGAEGVAWKQNRDYEILLRRLNTGGGEEAARSVPESMGFEQARNDGDGKEEDAEDPELKEKEVQAEETKKERKRRRRLEKEARAGEAEEAGTAPKMKKKKRATAAVEDEDDVSLKKRKKHKDIPPEASSSSGSATPADVEVPTSETPSTDASPAPSRPPRPMACVLDQLSSTRYTDQIYRHRARFRASKRMTALSSSAMSEILGISPAISSATTPYSTHSPSPAPFSQSTSNLSSATAASYEASKPEILTSATKSVADYFQEKLAAKGTFSGSKLETKRGKDERPDDEDDYTPKFGMGLGARQMQMAAIGFS